MTTPLLLAVVRRGSTPLYRQLYESFRQRILQGDLRGGEPVPSTRELARDLRISRIPVLNAYEQLLAEGYFESRVGSGTYVASSLSPRSSRRHLSRGERPISSNAAALPRYERAVWADSLGPFQIGQPDLRSFPVELWSRLVARCSRELRVKALQYGEAQGLLELREAIAAYLRRSRAVRCDAGQVFIVSGSQQALDLSTRVLLDAGSAAWVEDPGYWLVHHVLKASGCRAVPVPVDAEGLDVAAGARLSAKARAVFVAPSHQYPLGVTMSASRRLQLLEWAQRAGAWVIEDDYDSEFRYDSMPISSLQGLDSNDRVIYTGTFSKVMFPSLRLGYVVVPPDLVERFTAMRRAMDLCPPYITQAVMAEFIREGHFSRHIRRMRPLYARRRQVLIEAVRREFGARVLISGDEAGMHLALVFPDSLDDVKVAAEATERGLLVSALSASCVGEKVSRGFVLGFGNANERQIPAAVQKLKELLV